MILLPGRVDSTAAHRGAGCSSKQPVERDISEAREENHRGINYRPSKEKRTGVGQQAIRVGLVASQGWRHARLELVRILGNEIQQPSYLGPM